ncbi:unnamed protein product [Blumeria hordei]|uniref:J domain-containing protein n=1 Tax=Blumeria hordei TaxID=2867405 RepID=A0A383UP34_BLUHO|nr:unnamed protein product [Blumeria hordei]
MTISPPPDVYTTLGVNRCATAAEIRSSYRKLVLTCHPDKILDSSLKAAKQAEFQKVQEAYEILSDENRRQDHDDKVQIYELRKEMGRGNPTSRSNPYEFEVKTPKSTEPSKPKSSSSTSSIRVYTYTNPHNTSKSKSQEDTKYQSKNTSKKSPSENPDRRRSSTKDDEQRKAAHAKKLSEELERQRQREKELKREKKKAKEKKEKDRKRGSEEKRSTKTYAFVEDDTEDDPIFSPFSGSRPSKYNTDDLYDDGMKPRDENFARAKVSPDSGRKETFHTQQASRPTEKKSSRTSAKDISLNEKWNEHQNFAGAYMEAVRKKAAAPEVPTPPPGPQRAQSYAMPESSIYNIPSPRYTNIPNASFSPRYSASSIPPPTPRYSEEESMNRSSRRRERKSSSDIPSTRKKTKDVRSDSYPGELHQPPIVEPPSPPPSGRKAFPDEKPSKSEKYSYTQAQDSARRSSTIPPLSRSQTYTEPRSRYRKPELSSESESESPSVPRYMHQFSINYSVGNDRATAANTSRYYSEHRPVDEYFPMRSTSPHSSPHLYRNPSVSDYRGSHSYNQHCYYPPENEHYARHLHQYPLQREPISQQPPFGNINFAQPFRHENLIFANTPTKLYRNQIDGRG